MRDAQFGDILEHHDPLVARRRRKERPEQCRLAAAARPRDQQIGAAPHQLAHLVGGNRREEGIGDQLVEGDRPLPLQPDGDGGAARSDRRQHDVNPHARPEPHIHARGRLVDVPPAERDQPHRELARLACWDPDAVRPLCPAPAVAPHRAVRVDEHVAHPRLGHQGPEHPEPRPTPHAECRPPLHIESRAEDRPIREARATSNERPRRTHPLTLTQSNHGGTTLASTGHVASQQAAVEDSNSTMPDRSPKRTAPTAPNTTKSSHRTEGENTTIKREGRRLLGGTGAATATLDWGESRALQAEIALGFFECTPKGGHRN